MQRLLSLHILVGTCARTPPRQKPLAPPPVLAALEVASFAAPSLTKEAHAEEKDNLRQHEKQRDGLGNNEHELDGQPPLSNQKYH